jgi:hypothetical protein
MLGIFWRSLPASVNSPCGAMKDGRMDKLTIVDTRKIDQRTREGTQAVRRRWCSCRQVKMAPFATCDWPYCAFRTTSCCLH